mmetsp:Transcript_38073/g.88584  ORF Transcript_38073/g.88584 Transcript_38073/m.88584 type:complete len:153 (-) Transcript_38073:1512-1970(-)
MEENDSMLMLKRFTNLLYTIFLDTCPLFKAMVEIVRALKDYSCKACKRMLLVTQGLILWILLLQARQFLLGEVNLLYNFTTMHEDLWVKCASILHSEMPSKLLKNSGVEPEMKRAPKNTTPTNPIDIDKIPKKPKIAPNLNNWHLKLKEGQK